MLRWVWWLVSGLLLSQAALVGENLCCGSKLLVLQRRHPRPRLRDADGGSDPRVAAGSRTGRAPCSS